jgi:hypothetical protein
LEQSATQEQLTSFIPIQVVPDKEINSAQETQKTLKDEQGIQIKLVSGNLVLIPESWDIDKIISFINRLGVAHA